MPSERFEEIVDDFEFLDDWEDRYRYLIEMGKKMPTMDDWLKGPETKVEGCASQVWIAPEVEGTGAQAELHFVGDSDAVIVRGLIAVLHALFNGQTAEQILDINANAELSRLGLDQHLSSQRSNGLKAMIARIQGLANAMANPS